MRALRLVLALSVLLVAIPAFAQTPPAAQPPAVPPPATAKPTSPPPPPPTEPARPFLEGSKVAHLNIQRVVAESAEGKASNARVQALGQKKQNELADKTKALQASQQKLQSTVLSDAARVQLEKEIEKRQLEIQRANQDAQAEMQELQAELQADFQKKLMPIVEQFVSEKGIQILFSQTDSGIVWADPGLDVTNEVIKRLDASHPGTASAKPAPKPPPADKPAVR